MKVILRTVCLSAVMFVVLSGCCRRLSRTTYSAPVIVPSPRYQVQPSVPGPATPPPTQRYYNSPEQPEQGTEVPESPDEPEFMPEEPAESDSGGDTQADSASPAVTGIPRYRSLEAGISAGGQPTIDGLTWLHDRAFSSVLDLMPVDEVEPTEKAEVQRLGMRYLSLPVTPEQITGETLDLFNEIVDDGRYRPLFIHDRDGRVLGALWYLRRKLQDRVGEDIAMEEAEALGLSTDDVEMWNAIQKVIAEQSPDNAT